MKFFVAIAWMISGTLEATDQSDLIRKYKSYGIAVSKIKNDDIAYEKAYKDAVNRAKFFCGNDVVLPPTNVFKHIMPCAYSYTYYYVATFLCQKVFF